MAEGHFVENLVRELVLDVKQIEERLRELELLVAREQEHAMFAKELTIKQLGEVGANREKISQIDNALSLLKQDVERIQDSVGAASGIRALIDTMVERVKTLEALVTRGSGIFQGAALTVHAAWALITFLVSLGLWLAGKHGFL